MVAVPRPVGLHYSARVRLVTEREQDALWAGLAVVGDPFNTLGLGVRGGRLQLWKRRGDWQAVLWEGALEQSGEVWLRCDQVGGEQWLVFWYGVSDGSNGPLWVRAGEAVDASELPAWDRGLRVGLMLEGPAGMGTRFESFSLIGRDPGSKA